ncbi:MAG: hypothetical protein MUF48_02710 [Pirellulaceae bacterium]|jgi:hypothetical protein|nr:hypothetical protein [Pirellulaceae bacterium]
MDSACLVEQIRTLIRDTFAELGGASDTAPRESVLIRDGCFCGRRFEWDGLQAVWFAEEGEIKFYDRSGARVRVVALAAQARQRAPRHAA